MLALLEKLTVVAMSPLRRITLTKSPLKPVKSQEEQNLDVRPGIKSRSAMFGLKTFQAERKLSAGLVGCKMK